MDVATCEADNVAGGFRRKKVVQTVIWPSDLPKEFAISLVNKIVSVKRSKCQSTSRDLSQYSIIPVFFSSAVS